MSKRETHLMSIYFQNTKGYYKNFDEIKKTAEALKAKLEYLRKTKKDYFINAFIGISNFNIRRANLKYRENKKSGKNNTFIVPKGKYKNNIQLCLEPWHLHILLEANPAETIGEEVADYFNKIFGRKLARKEKIDNGFFDYVLRQSRYQRYVKETRDTDLVKIDFRKLYERYGKPKTQKRKKREAKAIKKLEKRSWERHRQKHNGFK